MEFSTIRTHCFRSHMSRVSIATGNTSVCGWRFEPTDRITADVVSMKHFTKILKFEGMFSLELKSPSPKGVQTIRTLYTKRIISCHRMKGSPCLIEHFLYNIQFVGTKFSSRKTYPWKIGFRHTFRSIKPNKVVGRKELTSFSYLPYCVYCFYIFRHVTVRCNYVLERSYNQ